MKKPGTISGKITSTGRMFLREHSLGVPGKIPFTDLFGGEG
jgi:hypothetical protein